MYHLKKTHSSTSPDHNPAFTQPKYATFEKRGRYRRGSISNIARRHKAKRQKKCAPRKSGARKNAKGFNDMPPRGKEGAIRKRTSANAPPLAAHCLSFLRRHARSLSCSFGLPLGVCLSRVRASARAARARACFNKHTYYCQFGFLRVFSIEY